MQDLLEEGKAVLVGDDMAVPLFLVVATEALVRRLAIEPDPATPLARRESLCPSEYYRPKPLVAVKGMNHQVTDVSCEIGPRPVIRRVVEPNRDRPNDRPFRLCHPENPFRRPFLQMVPSQGVGIRGYSTLEQVDSYLFTDLEQRIEIVSGRRPDRWYFCHRCTLCSTDDRST